MSKVDDVLAALQAVDAATTQAGTAVTAIAARIQALLDKIAAGATAEQLQSISDAASAEVAKLQPVADALTAMGATVDNPVPTPVPTPEPPPATT